MIEWSVTKSMANKTNYVKQWTDIIYYRSIFGNDSLFCTWDEAMWEVEFGTLFGYSKALWGIDE